MVVSVLPQATASQADVSQVTPTSQHVITHGINHPVDSLTIRPLTGSERWSPRLRGRYVTNCTNQTASDNTLPSISSLPTPKQKPQCTLKLWMSSFTHTKEENLLYTVYLIFWKVRVYKYIWATILFNWGMSRDQLW